MLAVDCGAIDYTTALGWQHQLVRERQADAIDDVVLTCEHEPVYTAGRHADVAGHVLGTRDIPVVRVDRGGDVTYHGPGQLVVYPIVRLRQPRAVRAYVAALAHACVRTAADFGVHAQPGRRVGVWVGEDKLAAIGVRVDRGVTSHGLAFNVHPRLDDFAGIVPCGIPDAGVCSLASLGVDTSMAAVRRHLLGHLARTLDRPLRPGRCDELGLVTA
ncbi:MAG: lipoyl(octanoyl) transferase LipB [Egibacteraceae bacterium]